MSELSKKLQEGKFITTIEISPPKGVDISEMMNKAAAFKGMVDAVNITDNQRATMHASPLSIAYLLKEIGLEPIYQLTCRDRNGIALQSELLSAAILGIENVLIVSGDYPDAGDHPYAKPVYDLDSVQLLKAAAKLQTGEDLAGNKLKGSPKFLLGAVVNPSATPQQMHLMKLRKKVDAGAQFIQTQVIYDAKVFNEFISQAPKIPIIAGIFPLMNLKIAKFMNERVPGVKVPQEILDRLEKAKDPKREGIEIAIETIRQIKESAAGIHIMAMNNVELIEEIIDNI